MVQWDNSTPKDIIPIKEAPKSIRSKIGTKDPNTG